MDKTLDTVKGEHLANGQEKQKRRKSNIELLRIISML